MTAPIGMIRRVCKPDDKLFEDGDKFLRDQLKIGPGKVSSLQLDDESLLHKTYDEFMCRVCRKTMTTTKQYDDHYYTAHTNHCPTCKRSFPSDRLVQIHIEENHDPLLGTRVNSVDTYRCLVKYCDNRFTTISDRKNHMIEVHCYPSDFRFETSKQPKKAPKKKAPGSKAQRKKIRPNDAASEAMEVGSIEAETVQDDRGASASILANSVIKPKIPKSISFGSGIQKSFLRAKKKKNGGWHESLRPTEEDTTIDIDQVDMSDLQEALSIN